MPDNICAICLRRISAHTIEEVKYCQDKYQLLEVERFANKECCSCGAPADMIDTDEKNFWCNGCLAWQTQLNDGS